MSVVLSSLIGFTSAIAHTRPAPLPDELQRCVEVIQRLEACREQPSYGAERQRAMQTLGVSERSLRRLQQPALTDHVRALQTQFEELK